MKNKNNFYLTPWAVKVEDTGAAYGGCFQVVDFDTEDLENVEFFDPVEEYKGAYVDVFDSFIHDTLAVVLMCMYDDHGYGCRYGCLDPEDNKAYGVLFLYDDAYRELEEDEYDDLTEEERKEAEENGGYIFDEGYLEVMRDSAAVELVNKINKRLELYYKHYNINAGPAPYYE